MKIAIVSPIMGPIPPKKYGGIELIVDELVRSLTERGHEVTVFCSGESTIAGPNITRIETSPYPTREHPDEHRKWEKKQLLAVLNRQHDFDVIHLNYEPIACRFDANGGSVNLLDSFEVPVALTFHNTTDIAANIAYYRDALSLHRHTMIFISENQRKRVAFFPKTHIIYNALPIGDFPLETKKENYLLFLGRITPSKGLPEAIAVARKTNIPLFIIAKIDPVDRDYYEKEIKSHIDGKLIHYLGEADFPGKVAYLKKARCLLFPILWEEPFGLVMIEALACGTPVIAFRRGSVPEIIQDGVNGFIVANIAEMAEAVKKIDMISPTKCRESVAKRFLVKRMADEYEDLFKKLALK
jgi:glycosyltransferase involved in cell wall biosynthesis